jgi:hypothetical protein
MKLISRVQSNLSEFVGYLLYLSEMLKIKNRLAKCQGDSGTANLTNHESSRGSFLEAVSPNSRNGRRRDLECLVFKIHLNVQAPRS